MLSDSDAISLEQAKLEGLRRGSRVIDADDLAVGLEDVWIRYKPMVDANRTIKGSVLGLWNRKRRDAKKKTRVIEAVRGVTMDIGGGTVMGIVGANGAGKSTLMRAMAGILAPSQGRIVVNGRVSTLLALGIGFNGNLSGRANVVLGGLAAGLTREEVENKFEEIAAFADLPEGFIEMPMRTYSSGMYGRLGFAVAVHMDPDILLIDEALSTGDAAFKEKSMDKMRELVSQARTIVIVSHAMGTIVELCNDAAWMHRGELIQRGDPEEVTESYLRFLKVGESAVVREDL